MLLMPGDAKGTVTGGMGQAKPCQALLADLLLHERRRERHTQSRFDESEEGRWLIDFKGDAKSEVSLCHRTASRC